MSEAFIGNAEMDEDRVVYLFLAAVFPNGDVGHSRLTYHPSHPKYEYILDHLGPMKPGDKKGVRPFPPVKDEEFDAD